MADAKSELNELKMNQFVHAESMRESIQISVREEFRQKIESLSQDLKRVELEKNLMESELGEVKSRLLKNKTNANDEVSIVVQN